MGNTTDCTYSTYMNTAAQLHSARSVATINQRELGAANYYYSTNTQDLVDDIPTKGNTATPPYKHLDSPTFDPRANGPAQVYSQHEGRLVSDADIAAAAPGPPPQQEPAPSSPMVQMARHATPPRRQARRGARIGRCRCRSHEE